MRRSSSSKRGSPLQIRPQYEGVGRYDLWRLRKRRNRTWVNSFIAVKVERYDEGISR